MWIDEISKANAYWGRPGGRRILLHLTRGEECPEKLRNDGGAQFGQKSEAGRIRFHRDVRGACFRGRRVTE